MRKKTRQKVNSVVLGVALDTKVSVNRKKILGLFSILFLGQSF